MSIILSWENPELTFLPQARLVTVRRGNTILSDDAPWGCFEDLYAIDPHEIYTVDYNNVNAGVIGTVQTGDIRRYVRPERVCKLNFLFLTADGSPWFSKKIRFTDPRDEDFSKVVCTSYSGKAMAFFRYNQRVLIEVSGFEHSLDCIIPEMKDASWEDLVKNGSWVLSELRGMTPP